MSPQVSSSRFRTAGALLAVLVLGTVAALKGLQAHTLARESSRLQVQVEAGPRVRVLPVRADGDGAPMAFHGETVPVASATLYAKIGGFVKEMRVDKGSRVRAGQVLAVLTSPETDRQTLALKASYDNLQRAAERQVQLGKEGIANAQDVDNAVAAARVAREQWQAQRLSQGYEQVLAPFSGVVTARLVDPGAFIQNATATLSAQPMLTVADLSRIRVDFFLDQATAALARVGQTVEISSAERPDLVRTGRIDRLGGTLDLRTRTLLAEVDLDNRDGQFLGGSYVNVALHLPKGSGAIEIPAEALLMRGSRAFAAAVDQGRVRLLPLTLGGDVGSQVRVLQGLRSGASIILNPGSGLRDGDRVQVAE